MKEWKDWYALLLCLAILINGCVSKSEYAEVVDAFEAHVRLTSESHLRLLKIHAQPSQCPHCLKDIPPTVPEQSVVNRENADKDTKAALATFKERAK